MLQLSEVASAEHLTKTDYPKQKQTANGLEKIPFSLRLKTKQVMEE
jgi:hypothetical protein